MIDLSRPFIIQLSAPRQVELVPYPPDPLRPGQVRVRTRYSGVSAGTELTAYRGTNPYLSWLWDPGMRLFTGRPPQPSVPTGAATPLGPGATNYPLLAGYSEVGVVTEVAPDVAAPAVGETVWGGWGHRSEAVLPAAQVAPHVVPAGVDALSASFARVGAIALNAVLAADLHLGELVVVFGQGVIGLLVTRLATLSGAGVVAVEGLASRREKAMRYGATTALGPMGAAEEIRRMTAGAGADAAIEVSGAYTALHEAIRTVGVAGRVVAAGFYQGDGVGLRLGEEFHHNRVQLVSSQIGGVPPTTAPRWDTERLQRVFLQQIADGAVDVTGLITHVVPAERAPEAYELLDRHPAEALQMVLEFDVTELPR